MKTLLGLIITSFFLLVGCSSREATIPFNEQYVKGALVKLNDSLLVYFLPDTIEAVPRNPTPYAPTLDVEFHVLKEDSVMISYYTGEGRLITSSYTDYLRPGLYRFHAADIRLNTGVYFIRCQVGKKVFVSRALIM